MRKQELENREIVTSFSNDKNPAFFLKKIARFQAASDTASKEAGDGNNSFDTIADYSDLDWPEMTWNFACSTTETSTWADGGRKFGELMEKATDVYKRQHCFQSMYRLYCFILLYRYIP